MTLADIALTLIPNLGPCGCRTLIDLYGSAEAVYNTPYERLVADINLRSDIANAIVHQEGFKKAEEEIAHISKHRIASIASTDDEYPVHLRNINDRPHVIYAMGNVEALHSPHILSVVGTRRISNYGEVACTRIIKELGCMFPDLVVVSGLAFGADSVAHRVALATGVRTVAVIPDTLPKITPSTHTTLARTIIDQGGALVSELNSHSRISANSYIPRNRIIAGISEGLFVIESAKNGGTLSTVRFADGYSRPIMALPGRITDNSSEGTNHIIKSRIAEMVTSAEDIAELLGWEQKAERQIFECNTQPLSSNEQLVIDCFAGNEALSTDEIAERCALSTSETSAILLELELSGLLRQGAGNRYEKF